MSLVRSFAPPLLLALMICGDTVSAQSPAAPLVRYTQAREHELRDVVVLPGSVQAHVQSLLATEVAGLVVELPAREGRAISKGDVIARLRTDELALRLRAAQGQHTEALARKGRAERQLGRARDLLAQEAISPEQFDDAYSEFNAWVGRIQQLEAEIERIELDIERCSIRALVGGVVVRELCEVGEWIGTGAPVVEIVSLDDLEVRLDVPERYYVALERGTRVELEIEALAGLPARGSVTAIIPRANPQARTFPVQVRIEQPDRRIGDGMLARVKLPVGDARRAVIVPKDAVVSGAQGRMVWVIGEDGTVASVAVQAGEAVGEWITVRGEVLPGARVVIRGNERLRPQQAVSAEHMEVPLP
jgi:RND family efflux transporter MFP subunit